MNTLDTTELIDIAGITSLPVMLAWAAVLVVRFIVLQWGPAVRKDFEQLVFEKM